MPAKPTHKKRKRGAKATPLPPAPLQSKPLQPDNLHFDRSHAPASEWPCSRRKSSRGQQHRGHGPLLPRDPAPAVGAGPARDTHPPKKKKGATSNPSPAPLQPKPLQPISLIPDPSHPPACEHAAPNPPAPPKCHRPPAGWRSFLCLPKEKNQKKGQPCR